MKRVDSISSENSSYKLIYELKNYISIFFLFVFSWLIKRLTLRKLNYEEKYNV